MKSQIDAWNAVTKERHEQKKTPQEEVAALHDLFQKNKIKKILDLGCGSGRHLLYFAKLGYDVCGIDVSPEAVKLSRKWLDHHLYAPTEGTEKGIEHYFFTEDELKEVLAGFNIIDIKEDKSRQHYCVLSQK